MKLKKIAALALAGVMAVSMLAGCGTDKKPGTGEGEGEGTVTTTGYSASVEKAMDLDKEDYDYITFKDNVADQTALQKAVNSLSTKVLEQLASNNNIKDLATAAVTTNKDTAIVDDLESALDIADNKLAQANFTMGKSYADNKPNQRVGVVYAVNGGVDSEYALQQVAKAVKTNLTNTKFFPDEANLDGVIVNYDYTVSASVVTRAQQDNYTGATNNTTFILVTVTRTVTW